MEEFIIEHGGIIVSGILAIICISLVITVISTMANINILQLSELTG